MLVSVRYHREVRQLRLIASSGENSTQPAMRRMTEE
jgi:hypothetical protein